MAFNLTKRTFKLLFNHKNNYITNFIKRTHSLDIGMDLSAVIGQLESFAPIKLAETWDNVGLLVEPSPPHNVKSLMLTNDLTENVLEEAINKSINLIVSYHPPLFKKFKRVTQDQWKDRIVIKAIENRIAIYSPHTSFDIVKGGTNDWLLSCFDGKIEPIIAKIEEEAGNGVGRICTLNRPKQLTDIIQCVKAHLGLSLLRVAYPIKTPASQMISSIACCAGSGGSVLTGVQTDVYLTGELSHHEILDATSNGKYVILCEHSNTERGYLKPFSVTLNTLLDNKVNVVLSQTDKDPVVIV